MMHQDAIQRDESDLSRYAKYCCSFVAACSFSSIVLQRVRVCSQCTRSGLEGTAFFVRYSIDIGHDQELHILSDPINSWGYATGNTLWTSAEELIDFFNNRYPKNHFEVALGAVVQANLQVIFSHPFLQTEQLRTNTVSGEVSQYSVLRDR